MTSYGGPYSGPSYGGSLDTSYGGLYTGPAYGGATVVGIAVTPGPPPLSGILDPYVAPPIVVHLRGADAVRVGRSTTSSNCSSDRKSVV